MAEPKQTCNECAIQQYCSKSNGQVIYSDCDWFKPKTCGNCGNSIPTHPIIKMYFCPDYSKCEMVGHDDKCKFNPSKWKRTEG